MPLSPTKDTTFRRAYLLALGSTLLTTLVAYPLRYQLDMANMVMLFLLTVFLVTIKVGRGPGVFSAIGAFAAPEVIHPAAGLPKTRSGKIMRRILRKIAENDVEHLGDTSTLLDPAVVDEIKAGAVR